MASIEYRISQINPSDIVQGKTISQEDLDIARPFEINTRFKPLDDTVELHIYGLDGELLDSNQDFRQASFLQNSEIAKDGQASEITLNPSLDVQRLGYSNGDVVALYNFVDDLFSDDKTSVEFFIEEISPDRTEIRLLTVQLTDEEIQTRVDQIKTELESTSYFSDFRLNFKQNQLVIGIGIDTQQYNDGISVIVKLYEPLPIQYKVKTKLNVQEVVSDTVAYIVETQVTEDEIQLPRLKGPNFNIELDDTPANPSQYFNYDELFSYPLNNTYREVTSLLEEKGMELSIDYSDFENFTHFSSIEERIRNFQYKLNLIETYQTNIDLINNANNTEGGITGSRAQFTSLINNILQNFDHYDRYLYYESSSFAWPKTNNTRPYINATGGVTGSYITRQLLSASLFDNDNPHLLTNSIPTFLRDDPNNERYLLFTNMLAQHFDNLWIYSKAITDKYDGDNRLNRGIPRELVEDALRNFGVKLYSSNRTTEDLFKYFTGELYNTGSEDIETFVTYSNSPISEELYKDEVYKRLYHNLPLLLKAKGTERGVRALFNSFGIPTIYSSGSHPGLQIKLAGGVNTFDTSGNYFGPATLYTSSLDKIRLDNTGSIVTGSTLSINTSIVERDDKFTDDLHTVEVGYSPSYYVNDFISSSLSSQNFNIDQLIGDPREFNSHKYSNLMVSASQVLQDNERYDLKDFTRLLKFYDNVIFKMIKDFIPARDSISQGIIIKPHLLERSKIKQVEVSTQQGDFLSNLEVTGSIETGFAEGQDGGVYKVGNTSATTSYVETVQTPDGLASYDYHDYEVAKIDGELSGSAKTITDGELNRDNVYKVEQSSEVSFTPYFIDQSTDCSIVWEASTSLVTKSIRVEVGLTGSGNYWTRYGWRQVGVSSKPYDYIVSSSFTTGDTVLTGSIDVKDNVEYNKLSQFTESLDQGISGPIDITIRDYADGVLKNTAILTNQTNFNAFNNTFPENTSTYTAVTRSIQIEEIGTGTVTVAAINIIEDSNPCNSDPGSLTESNIYVPEDWDGFTLKNGYLVVDNTKTSYTEVQMYDINDSNVQLSPNSVPPEGQTDTPPGPQLSLLVRNTSLKLQNQNLVKGFSENYNPFIQFERCTGGGEIAPVDGGDPGIQ